MKYTELRDICRVYGLYMSRCKDDLIRRLQLFMDALSNFDRDKVCRIESSENSDSDND